MFRKSAPPTTVLLAGNQEELHPLVRALEQSAKHKLIAADDTADALFLLHQGLADVAIFDLTLEGADGAEILRELKTLDHPIPVLFLSDSRDVSYALELMRAGAADCFVKPVSAKVLQEALDRIDQRPHPRPPALPSADAPPAPPLNGVAQNARDTGPCRADRLEALGRLLDAVAHDLKNQTTVLLGLSGLARAALPANHPLRGHIDEIYHAAERSAALSRQVLDYGRDRRQDPEAIDVNVLVAGMCNMIQRLVGGKIEFATALKARPAVVKADSSELQRVVMNLVLNARDAMPEGGTLAITTGNDTANPPDNGKHSGITPLPCVRLWVRDSGPGIEPAVRNRLFEPSFTTSVYGHGLGLKISSQIVERYGGQIRVHSALGQGTTFEVRLPQHADSPQPPPEAQPQPRPPQRGSETVLVVEDDEPVRHLVREVLIRSGYRVLEAGTAAQALVLGERHPARIDLLITDVSLPQMDGPQLARRLLALRPDLKVLYTSGYSNPINLPNGQPDPDAPFIQKPFHPAALLAKVREVLDKGRT